MKKSLIALSLVSVFAAGGASAATVEGNARLIDANNAQIGVNYDSIQTNKAKIVEVEKRSIENEAAATENRSMINTNTSRINDNERDITHNRTAITDNTQEIEKISKHNAEQDKQIGSNTNRIVDIEKAGSAAYEEIYAAGDTAAKYIDAAGRQAVEAVSKNTSDIADLRKDFNDMSQRQDRFEDKLNKMDKKMDGVMAGTHAVTNARPMVAGGQTAFGVGTGFAGSAQAVAVGVAHNFKDSAWSVSATTNVSTGSGVKTQVSGGVGAHYVF